MTSIGFTNPKAIYDTALKALVDHNRARELINGVSLEGEKVILMACAATQPKSALSVVTPFNRRNSDRAFWRDLRTFFEDNEALAAVQGIRKPSDHWVAIKLDSNGMVIISDSDPSRKRRMKLRPSDQIWAGSKAPDGIEWLIKPAETLLICRDRSHVSKS